MAPLTAGSLLYYGRCCGNSCVNCPYIPQNVAGTKFTKESIKLKQVEILRYYGLPIQIIEVIAKNGYHTIGDLYDAEILTQQPIVKDALDALIADLPPENE